MPDYLAIILIVTPGFIAQRASRWVGNFNSYKKSQFDIVMSYFCYSLFAGIVSAIGLVWKGYLPADTLTTNYETIAKTNVEFIKILLIVVLSSFLTGVAWEILLKPLLSFVMNKVYGYLHNGNTIYDGGSFLVSQLSDGKDHLIKIIQDDKEIAFGKFLGISADAEDRPEIAVESYVNYKLWIDVEQETFVRKATYVVIQNNLIVEEYSYPEGFFEGQYKGKELSPLVCESSK